MKKILGIIASPRKLGNSEIVVKEISRHISVPHELNLLRLSDFNILPCRGCYQCLFKSDGCPLPDDLYQIIGAIAEADALILAAPTYFLGANACLKLLLDRGIAFYAHAERIWEKPALGVGIAGIEGKEGDTLLTIEKFLKIFLSQIKGVTMLYGALPGEVFLNTQNKEICTNLAQALFGDLPEKKTYACPLCGGETFRFLGENRVKCMLCSNSGTVRMTEGIPVFEIRRSEHELFLSKEEALKHREWLRSMKDRFVTHKKELKEITVSYLKDGNWIKPVNKE
jgi:multimeric flavodoxin WrbA